MIYRAVLKGAANQVVSTGPDGTQFYVEVTIQSSQVASTLTDFSVYVDLSDLPAAFWTNVQSDGGDIRVTESDGTTRCPVDLVAINTGSSTGEMHFLASSVSSSSNTTFRIYYDQGGGATQPGVATTYGRNAVWTDYGGVWHLQDDTALIDSTGNGGTGTIQSGGASNATGKLGQGLSFLGLAGDRVTTHDDAALDASTALTIQAWMLFDNTDNAFVLAKDDGSSRAYWMDVNSGNLRISLHDGAVNNVSGAALSTATWYLMHGTYDGTNQTIYYDGSQSNTSAVAASGALTNSSAVFAMGDRSDGTSATVHTGDLDEVRVALVTRSADWIASEYTNQNTPNTFYSVGSQTAA